jgi:hypothetical protein
VRSGGVRRGWPSMIYQGIEYQARASLGRNEWMLLIHYPDKANGKATVSKFTGTRDLQSTLVIEDT